MTIMDLALMDLAALYQTLQGCLEDPTAGVELHAEAAALQGTIRTFVEDLCRFAQKVEARYPEVKEASRKGDTLLN